MTIVQFTEKIQEFLYFLEIEKNVSKHTLSAYESDLTQFTNFWIQLTEQEKSLLSLKQIIERFLVSLFYKKITKSSVARKLSCFRSFEKFLHRSDIQLALTIKRPRLDKKLPVYLSIDEITYLLDSINDTQLPTKFPIRDKAILEILYATGIRCAELINITLKSVNLEEKTIRIHGKGRKERIVLFGSKAEKKLLEYLHKERPNPLSLDEPLFISYRNKPLTNRSVQRIIKMFGKCIDNKKITPHKIRHSFATHLVNQGVDLRAVQELLGHATITSTERYAHISADELHKACNQAHPLARKQPSRKNSE